MSSYRQKEGGYISSSGGRSKNYSKNNNYSNSNSKPHVNTIDTNRDRTPSPVTDGSISPLGFDLSPVNSVVQGTWTKGGGGKSWIKEERPWTSICSVKLEDPRQLKSPSPTPSTSSGGSNNKFSGLVNAAGDAIDAVDAIDADSDDNTSVSSLSSTGTTSSVKTARSDFTDRSSPNETYTYTLVESVERKDTEAKNKIIQDFIDKTMKDQFANIKDLNKKLFLPKLGLGGKPLYLDSRISDIRPFHDYFIRDKFLKPGNKDKESDRILFDKQYSNKNKSEHAELNIIFTHVEKLVDSRCNDEYITLIINKHFEYQGIYRYAIMAILYLQLIKSNNHLAIEDLDKQADKYREASNNLIKFGKKIEETLNTNPEYRKLRERIDAINNLKDKGEITSVIEEKKLDDEIDTLLSQLNEIKSNFIKSVESEKIALLKEKEKNLMYDINKMPIDKLSSIHPCSWTFMFSQQIDKENGTEIMDKSDRNILSDKVKSTLSLLFRQHNILKLFNKGDSNKVFLCNLINNKNLHPDFISDIYNFVMDVNNNNSDFWLKYFTLGLKVLNDNLDKHFVYIGLTKFSIHAYTEIYRKIHFFSSYDPKEVNNKCSSLEKIYEIIFAGNYPKFYKSDGTSVNIEFNRYYENLDPEFHSTLPEKIVSYMLDNFKSILEDYNIEGKPDALVKASRAFFLFLGKAYSLGICRNKIINFLSGFTSTPEDIELFIRSFNHFVINLFNSLKDIKFEDLDLEVKGVFERFASLHTSGPIYVRYLSNIDNIFGKGSFEKIFGKNTKETISVSTSVSSESISSSVEAVVELPKPDEEIMDAIANFMDILSLTDETKINSGFIEFEESLGAVGKFDINQAMALAFCESIVSYPIEKVRKFVNMIDNTGALKALIKAQEEQVPGLFDYYKEYFCENYEDLVNSL
jgi:hypothetical protein